MLFDEACNYLAGGVGSAARGVKAGYTPYPLFIEKGVGSKIYDVDKNEYIDYLCALGPLIHGHAHPKIIEAIKREIEKGTMYAAPYELEFNAAKKVGEAVPSIDLVRFGNSGTEAVQTAIRLARAYKGKDKIIKFEGHYHGWADNVIVSCHPPLSAMGLRRRPHKVPQTNGIPESAYEHLIIIPWNDKELLEKTIKDYKHEIAAVITEPYMGNSACELVDYKGSSRHITYINITR